MENKNETAQHKMNNENNKPEWLKQATQYEQASDLKAAEDIYKAQLAKNPNDDDALCGMAGIACSVRNYDAAVMFANNAVKVNPKNVSAITYIGLSLFTMGHYKQAEACFNQAIEIEPNYPMSYYHLASIQYEQHKNNDKAIELINKALELNDDTPLAWNLLGVINAEEGWHIDALDCYNKVIALGVQSDEVYKNKAMVHVKRGEFSDALASYENALRLQPLNTHYLEKIVFCLYELGNPKKCLSYLERLEASCSNEVNRIELYRSFASYWMSLNDQKKVDYYIQKMIDEDENYPAIYNFYFATRKVKETDWPKIEKIIDLLENHNLTNKDKCALYYSLAKAYDYLKMYKKAFVSLKKANKLSYESLKEKTAQHKECNSTDNQDAAVLEHVHKYSVENFTIDFFEKRKSYALEGPISPIFIVGMPRSGTTLVEQIVSSHSKVVGCGELKLLSNAINYKLTKHYRRNERNVSESNDVGFPMSLLEASNEDVQACAEYYLSEIKRSYDVSSAKMITDKMPVNFLNIPIIKLMFKGVKIIHCARHPLDTCLSILFQNFNDMRSYMCHLPTLARIYRVYHNQMKYYKTILQDNIYENSYEQLLNDPEIKAKELLEFCKLDWEVNCLNFHENEKQVKTASIAQVRQPLYQTSRQRWKNYEAYLEPLAIELSKEIKEYEEEWMGK